MVAGGLVAGAGAVVGVGVPPHAGKIGERVRVIQVATAPIDASGNFVLRPDPTSRSLARAIVEAITNNSGWVNLDLVETGADGKTAITGIPRQYVDASGKPLSLAEFRAAPDSGHWVGDGTGSTTVDPKYEVALPHR